MQNMSKVVQKVQKGAFFFFYDGKCIAYFTFLTRRYEALPNLEAQLNLGVVFQGTARFEEQFVDAPIVELIPVGPIDP